MVVVEKARVGINVVDGAAIDAGRRKNARVSGDAGEIGADAAVFEKDGSACVAAFDAAIEIVPLVHPADGCIRPLRFVEAFKRFAERNFAEESEDAVEDATIVCSSNDEAVATMNANDREPEAVISQIWRWTQFRDCFLNGRKSSQNDCRFL